MKPRHHGSCLRQHVTNELFTRSFHTERKVKGVRTENNRINIFIQNIRDLRMEKLLLKGLPRTDKHIKDVDKSPSGSLLCR